MLSEAKHLLLFEELGDKQIPFGKLRTGFADAQNDSLGVYSNSKIARTLKGSVLLEDTRETR